MFSVNDVIRIIIHMKVFAGQQGKGEGICLTPLHHFHSRHRRLNIFWVITAESSPLHIARGRS